MSLKDTFKGKSWLDWEEPYRNRDPETMIQAKKDLKASMDLYRFEQYEFEKQWQKLKEYAHVHHIQIIGDMPFYTSMDSSDTWADREVFRFLKDGTPEAVAGCAPDAFAPQGQLWGNPLYDWKALKKARYGWWADRVKRNMDLFDIIRIDHFEGFVDYYAIPYGKTADLGTSEKGPGMDLFEALEKKLGKVPVIAEDLGSFNPEMKELLKKTGIPGMNVLEYAFTSWNSTYLPYKNIPNSVIYTGTHDNPPVREWLEELNEGSLSYLKRFMNTNDGDYGALTWDFLREAYRSPSSLCIIPIQDYFAFGKESRLNTPGTSQGNWQWRVVPDFLSDDLAYSIRGLCETYGRIVNHS
jgi:4-alpha-glucanotransferase